MLPVAKPARAGGTLQSLSGVTTMVDMVSSRSVAGPVIPVTIAGQLRALILDTGAYPSPR